ncbi:putative EH domain, EF-hand domain, EF-hand domain pair, EF-Hand 1, calcium-binding protein [Dioscorea sansibarensis]
MAAAPNMDKFEAYFVRADLDRDGRISGQEAVAFFQGSNLPKQILAQIWMHADQNRTGFLGRTEFYNALRLVTVAQSGRELTADIVKAALYGPAAAKIPAPQINPVMAPAVQMNPAAIRTPQINPAVAPATQMNPAIIPAPQSKPAAPPSTQMGQISTPPASSQSPALQGPQAFPSMGANQQFFSTDNLRMRQPQPGPSVASMQGQVSSQVGSTVGGPLLPGSNTANLSTNWLGGSTGSSVGGPSHLQIRGNAPSVKQDGFGPELSVTPKATPPAQTSLVAPKPQDLLQSSFQPNYKDSKASVSSGNGFPSDSLFGGDGFSAMAQAKKDVSNAAFSSIGMSNSSGIAPVASGSQNSIKAGQLNPLQQASAASSGGSQLQQTQAIVQPNQFNIMQSTALNTSNVSVGPLSSASNESQQAWPKITQSDVQKYTRVFLEVDKDRDGKITGEQARNLFLSWRLPREILKQVWDLSDQDNDSMLSLREFCTALYLMERYREGRTLPSTLPNSLKYDDTLLRATGQPSLSYGGPTFQPSPGFSQQGMPGSHPVFPGTGLRPPLQNSVSSQIDGRRQPHQNSSRMAANQHFKEQGALDANSQEPTNADKKVQELEKEILDSKEKIEFYRNKMQELVLYKSRCDNRLNEITERASADKREVESLGKKYEEKYKQVGDVASKLTVEEARYRDIQERKMELHNAIIKVEQGGSADGLLQVRADRIQSDLEELEKALNERCKQHGMDVKPTTTIKLPFGWQPGVQEGAMDWDEDWDKFEDEGFTLENEVNSELGNAGANATPKSPAEWDAATDEVSSVASSRYTNGKVDKTSRAGEPIIDESVYAQSEGSTWSPHGSPGRSALGSPSREFHSTFSPRTKESSSEHLGAESTVSGDKFFDEPSWGATFDANDDVDSVWGFNSATTKDIDHERTGQSSFFGSRDFGLNPINVSSPSASSVAGKEKSSIFADSVPSTPLFNSSSPPGFNERQDDRSFDSFSRFDSFNMNDSGFFSQKETLTRFDSISSTRDSDHNRGFPSFDDADPFGSSGPFKSSESHSPKRDSGSWNAF